MSDKHNDEQKRTVRRNMLVLIVVAFAVYGGFIAASVLRSQAGV
ncbi:MAG: hypothetical protein AAF270_13860 [Pseudomonadota bacterium]